MPLDTSKISGFARSPTLHPSAWLFVATLALLSGQAAAALALTLPKPLAGVLAVPAFLLISRRQRQWAAMLLLAVVGFALGYVRHRELLDPQFSPHHLRTVAQENSRFYLEGSLRYEPESLPDRSRWVVKAERIWHPSGAEEITGNMLIGIRHVGREWRYGDRVRFWIRPVIPRDNGNPGSFRYAAYLAQRQIYVTGFMDSDGEVELLARSPGYYRGAIESLRRKIRRHIDSNFSTDNGALMKALVLGDTGHISKTIRKEFMASGLSHVLAISGLHVGMLGLVVFALCRVALSFNRYLALRLNLLKVATLLSFVAVLFYTALAGAKVPTVRAAIMLGVYELAVLLDREDEILPSLSLAALLIALIWPGAIADVSFQLSFVAVLAIAWVMPQLLARARMKPAGELPQERSWIKQKVKQAALHLAVPVFATVGTAPLIAHYFGHVSLAGFLANPAVVPLVGFAVVPLGLLTGFLALIYPSLALALNGLSERLLSLTLQTVTIFAHLPLARISVPSPNVFEVIILYLLLLSILFWRKYHYRWALPATVLWLSLLSADMIYWWKERWARSELRVTHLDVGHGDAAVVELPGSKVLLIDAGGTLTGEFDTGEGIVGPFLRSRKILKVDYVAVTHARVDHYGGMASIVRNFLPSEFWSGPGKAKSTRFEELEKALDETPIRRIVLDNQQPCRIIDRVRVCTLHPAPGAPNDAVVVLRLEFGDIRFLFASDIDRRGEMLLQLQPQELRSAVLKAPRHGAVGSSTNEFLAAIQPRLAIFSVDARNRFGLPRDDVLRRYRDIDAEIMRTDEDGAIVIKSDGLTVRYAGHKSGRKGRVSF